MRRLGLSLGLLTAAGAGLVVSGGCSTNTVNSALRALEESGRVSFVCLSNPKDARPARPLEDCRNRTADANNDYVGGAGGSGATGGGGSGGATTSTSSTGDALEPNEVPHLYALVTQTFRGEVAVVDLTTTSSVGDWLIDQDPSVPGPNFLPVGAQPIGIVSTPGSTATFVTSAEVGKEAIYAIPSSLLVRRASNEDVSQEQGPHLSTWPSCALPAAPGEPVLLEDLDSDIHTSCSGDGQVKDGDGTVVKAGEKPPPFPQAQRLGDLSVEQHGRQKLAVPLPSLGGVAILDAQEILNLHDGYLRDVETYKKDLAEAKKNNTEEPPPPAPPPFPACHIERWVLLDSEVPIVNPPSYDPPPGLACVAPKVELPQLDPSLQPMPAGMAYAGDRLYVADLALPLVHRLNVDSPCAPKELPPLIATSVADPSRVVTTSRLSVTERPTAKLQRFLYADDVGEGTVMVFDVSDSSTSLTPLLRPHAEWTPLTPADRLRFTSAPRDMVVAQRDVAQDLPPKIVGGTSIGVAPEGTLCDPDPLAETCPNASAGDVCQVEPGTLYRTESDYSSGAGPYKLRGSFNFVLLTSGQIEIVDIEDFDAPCRIPDDPYDGLLGCAPPTCTKASPECRTGYTCPKFDAADPATATHVCERPLSKPKASASQVDAVCDRLEFTAAPFASTEPVGTKHTCYESWSGTDELSCNEVQPNTLRGSAYFLNDTKVGNNAPGITQLPLAFDKNGSYLDPTDDPTIPSVRATLPATGERPLLSVSSALLTADEFGAAGDGATNLVALNLETPRAQNVNQSWTVTFEGPLPRLGLVAGELRVTTTGQPDPAYPDGVYDASAAYCDGGVQSRAAVRDQLVAEGTPASSLDAESYDRADRVELSNALPDQDSVWWKVAAEAEDAADQCTFEECRVVFGDADAPLNGRDFVISEAYQDRLVLEDTAAVNASGEEVKPSALRMAKCCFPTFVNYAVRPGDQWTVVGTASGFQHHTVPDPVTGACRTSCEPYKERMNGRAARTERKTTIVTDPATSEQVERILTVKDGAPTAFINQQLRFAVIDGKNTQPSFKRPIDKKADPNRPQRDTQFRVTTTGAFTPLTVTLLTDTRDIAPVGIRYISPTGELAITDGNLQGLLTVSLSSVSTSRQLY